MKTKRFELVVPAYNEAKNLKLLIERAKNAALESGFTAQEFQMIIINNGSFDESEKLLNEFKNSELGEWFSVVKVEVNQGYGYGLTQGLKSVTAPYVAWSHADLQCDPKDAFKGLSLIENKSNTTLVKGVRIGRDTKDKLVSRVFECLAWLILGVRVYEMNAQPKVFPSAFLKLLVNPPQTFAFDLYALYIAQKNNYQIQEIEVLFPPRIHGMSNWASHFLSRYKTIFGIIRYMWHLRKHEGRV